MHKINECLVAKNLLTNVTKMNEYSNGTTFVHALVCLVCMYCMVCVRACVRACVCVCVCEAAIIVLAC